MPTTEAPQFVYSETERDQMLHRIRVIASKDAISARELEEVAWLVLERDQSVEEGNYNLIGYHGKWEFPQHPRIRITDALKGEYFQMAVLEVGKTGPEDTGELVYMDTDEKGALTWRTVIGNSIYSRLLGRRVLIEGVKMEEGMAKEPLTPKDHALVAKRLSTAYLEMVAEKSGLS